MTLHQRNQTAMQSTSPKFVQQTLKGLKAFTKSSRWIGSRNWYATDTRTKINAESARGANLRSPKQLAQYIAASPLLHCTDGWSYLGKSMSAMLRGDPHRSRHLAYYAELRAAMALLATDGIGVFDKHHYVICGRDAVRAFPIECPTHRFVWDCLEAWCKQSISGDLFSRVVRPNARDLALWTHPIGGAPAVAAKAREWFLEWGMDLNLPPQDRESRNISSYRPDGIPDSWRLDVPETLKFTSAVWTALEPAPSSSFDSIDRHILRLALESYFKGQYGVLPKDNPSRYRVIATSVVDGQGFAQSIRDEWIDFLCRSRASEDPDIFRMSRVPPNLRDNSHMAIISRATLLLRMASGATAELFRATGYTSGDTEFWKKELGISRGLWDAHGAPNDLTDLWEDVNTYLLDIHQFQLNCPPPQQTFFRLSSEAGQALVGLGSCERVALWSMTPT